VSASVEAWMSPAGWIEIDEFEDGLEVDVVDQDVDDADEVAATASAAVIAVGPLAAAGLASRDAGLVGAVFGRASLGRIGAL